MQTKPDHGAPPVIIRFPVACSAYFDAGGDDVHINGISSRFTGSVSENESYALTATVVHHTRAVHTRAPTYLIDPFSF